MRSRDNSHRKKFDYHFHNDETPVNKQKLSPILVELERKIQESKIKLQKLRQQIEDYKNGRQGSDNDHFSPIIPDDPKTPLNLGGYKKLEDYDE